MNRRDVIFLLCGTAAAWPFAAHAQQAGKVYRIGFLGNSTAALEANLVEPFRDGLRDLGYVEGQNILIEYRWAEGKYERFPALTAELIALKVDTIITAGTPASLAVKNATTTIPLVMVAVGDPVATGLVASLARPGGNITGLTSMSSEMEGKRLELLREVVPKVSHIAVLWNAASPIQVIEEGEVRAAARVLGMKNAVSRSAYPGRDRRRISDNHPGASRRAPSCSQIGCSCTIARASWTLPPKSACRGCMRTGNCLIVVRRTGIWAVANPEVFQCCGFEECCPAAVSIYLLIDRGSRV